MPVKIVIADDHKLFRAGLAGIVEQFDNMEVVGQASDGKELLTILRHKKPDVVLLDLNMPVMNGMDTLAVIKTKYPDLRVVVISMFDGDSYISAAIEQGACGYLHKNADPDEIAIAIASARENGFYFNERTNKAMLQSLVKRKKLSPVFDENSQTMNDTELQVLRYLCDELTNAEIAEKLFLSKRTVEGVRANLISKTGSKNIVGLALFAAKHGLIDL